MKNYTPYAHTDLVAIVAPLPVDMTYAHIGCFSSQVYMPSRCAKMRLVVRLDALQALDFPLGSSAVRASSSRKFHLLSLSVGETAWGWDGPCSSRGVVGAEP